MFRGMRAPLLFRFGGSFKQQKRATTGAQPGPSRTRVGLNHHCAASFGKKVPLLLARRRGCQADCDRGDRPCRCGREWQWETGPHCHRIVTHAGWTRQFVHDASVEVCRLPAPVLRRCLRCGALRRSRWEQIVLSKMPLLQPSQDVRGTIPPAEWHVVAGRRCASRSLGVGLPRVRQVRGLRTEVRRRREALQICQLPGPAQDGLPRQIPSRTTSEVRSAPTRSGSQEARTA